MSNKGWHGFFVAFLSLLTLACLSQHETDWAKAFCLLMFFYGFMVLMVDSIREGW